MPLRLTGPALLALLIATVAAEAAPAPRVDDTALRYYASLGQKDRVAAEVKRLVTLDPSWQAPVDLYAGRPGRADEEPLWALFAQDRLDELAKAVRLRQTAEPNWRPSDDLAAKIKFKELRAQILSLARAEDWRGISRSFEVTGTAWAKDDAAVLWIMAEAYAREKNYYEAYALYRVLLADHADPAERRATLEHAIAFIPMALTEKLIAMGRRDAAGHSEFEPIAVDITRARISAYLHDEPASAIPDDELQRFKDAVRDAGVPNELGLVAWYAFKQRDYPQALDWFKLAISHGGDAMVAHGLAHTLRKLGMRREAEEVAYAWREPLVNNAILFVDLLEEDLTKEQPPYIEPERISRYAQLTMTVESGEGAQALAWYAYNTCQYPLALQWFERAVAWLPKEATVYGYALALQRLHRAKEFRDTVNRYDGLFPKVVALAFDDGIRRPPSACDANAKQLAPAHEAVAAVQTGMDGAGRTMADTLRPQPVVGRDIRPVDAARFTPARVPSPEALGAASTAVLKKLTDFPHAVSPENPLRFSAAHTASGVADAQDRQGSWPLVARRVPGVGAMPYERFGFVLLPGWDGTREASSPSAAERGAPEGTLWALEQSLRDSVRKGTSPKNSDGRRPLANAGPDRLPPPDPRS